MKPHIMMSCLLIGLLSLQAAADDDREPPSDIVLVTHVRLTDDRIEYRGIITAEANAGVFDLYATAEPKPTTLWIQSQGGSAGPAMELGAWLFDHQLDVAVDTFCFSSCANYVFPAGRSKLLAPRASLMWHGGVTQPITPEQLEQVLDHTLADMDTGEKQKLLSLRPRAALLRQLELSRLDLIEREAQFFEMIGVDRNITSLGHRYERELLKDKGYYMGWDYSLEDLARLGVCDVRIKDDLPWTPTFPVPGQSIYRISLASLPQFQPRLPTRQPPVPGAPEALHEDFK